MKTLYLKATGEAFEYETEDAKAVLELSPDLYTERKPRGAMQKPDDEDEPKDRK